MADKKRLFRFALNDNPNALRFYCHCEESRWDDVAIQTLNRINSDDFVRS
jgi:hypothetical protein